MPYALAFIGPHVGLIIQPAGVLYMYISVTML